MASLGQNTAAQPPRDDARYPFVVKKALNISDATNVRIDRYQTDKLHLFGRYTFYRTDQSAPGAFGLEAGGPNFSTAGFAGTSSLRNQSLAYGMDYTISPTWITDFRFGFFRYRVFVSPNGLGTSPAKGAGIPGLNLDSYYTSGMPNFYINGTGGFSTGYALNNDNNCNCPLNEQENNFQWVDNTTRTVGNHSIKIGADFRYAQNLRVPRDSHRSGILTFNAVTTSGPNGGGLPLASFLLGQVSSFARYVSESTTATERQHRLFTYAQDTWRITPKLTVNYGVRWEIYFPQYVNGANQGATVSLSTGEVLMAGQNGVNDTTLNAKHSEAWNQLGVARQNTGDRNGALPAYRRAVALDASNLEARNNFGFMLVSEGHAAEGVAQFRKILAADPFNIMVLVKADYWTFFELVAGPIATAVAEARPYEEERNRAEALAELDLEFALLQFQARALP